MSPAGASRVGEQVVAEGLSLAHIAPLDEELLTDVLIAVDLELTALSLSLEHKKKARLTTLLYSLMAEKEAAPLDNKKMKSMIRLVAQ